MTIDTYLQKQSIILSHHEKQHDIAYSNLRMAQTIQDNIRKTKAVKGFDLHEFRDDISSGINMVTPAESTDPVYKKLQQCLDISRKSPYTPGRHIPYVNLSVYIHDIVDILQTKIERREMKEDEYEHLYKSSKYKLLDEWAKKIELEKGVTN